MKRICLVLFLFAFVSVGNAQREAVLKYIEDYKDLAMSEMIRSGVPASITLAQGILESRSGQSDLVMRSNNHFGIKCKPEWTGGRVYHDDDLKGECFRSYGSAEESYKDHSDFLTSRSFYASLFKLDPADYKGWATGLKKAGYATSSSYAPQLIKIIEDYNLQQYSLLALKKKQQNPEEPVYATNTNNNESRQAGSTTKQESVNSPRSTAVAVAEKPVQSQNPGSIQVLQTKMTAPVAPMYPPGVFKINNTKVTFADAGTSLFALANNNNISYKKLLEFNELTDTEILDNGQLIFLEKKPKKGATESHIVAEGETLEMIAQKEGIQLESLIQYNHLSKTSNLTVGQKLFLKNMTPSK